MHDFVAAPAGSGVQSVQEDTRVPPGKHYIKRELRIHSGSRLVIEPGATLAFSRGVGITVLGVLLAEGQPEAPIVITGTYWSGITFIGPEAGGSRLEHVQLSRGEGRSWSRELDPKGFPLYNNASGHAGGACQIYDTQDAAVSFRHAVFEGNGPTDHGGAIDVESSAVACDACTFRGNKAAQGGAIRALNAVLRLSGCTFEDQDNEETSCAGAGLYAASTNGDVERCTFRRNLGLEGGGVYARDAALHFRECAFEKNRATGSGGGLFIVGRTFPALTQCTFKHNIAAEAGGGLQIDAEQKRPMLLKQCTFIANQASLRGAGVSLTGSGTAQLESCTFKRNRGAPEPHQGAGGALFCAGGTRAALVGCELIENQAHVGGAIATDSDAEDGGGARAHVTLRGCVLTKNSTTLNGGAIRLGSGDSIDLGEGNRFAGNQSGGAGGALHGERGAQLLVVSVAFDENTAQEGGALCWHGERARVDSCVFNGNTAERIGGALACHTPLIVRAVKFTGNRAGSGGAIWCLHSRTLIGGCTFNGNIAEGSDGGGAIGCRDTEGSYHTENTFSRNRPDDVAYRDQRFPASKRSLQKQSARSCWIVTAYYGDAMDERLCVVRDWRDALLADPLWGPLVARADRGYRRLGETIPARWWAARLQRPERSLPHRLTGALCDLLYAVAMRRAVRQRTGSSITRRPRPGNARQDR